MGIPKFFRWLTGRYPAVLQRLGSSSSSSHEETSSDDMSSSCGLPVDHLYLDMNGIIHQCSHNNSGKVVSISFEQIFQNIVAEINRIITLVRPQQLLFIAIDGVAPRAKLNQQRTRRFRAARDAMSKSNSFNSINQSGMTGYGGSMYFDSNCITPGTQFMHDLSKAMHLFIDYSMKNNPLWSRLKVHFSGSQVPGEGEHKIISFIRDLRASDRYVPNTRHCVVGADADMIVLALATHEPYFIVLRDDIYYQQTSKGYKKNKNYTSSSQHQHQSNNGAKRSSGGSNAVNSADKQRMCFVRINVLRECIATELLADLSAEHSTPHQRERLIDDFVFLTFLVGNDFLPSLPAIDIGDSAFDIIFDAYKTVMLSAEADGTTSSSSSFLVCEGHVDVRLLELIFSLIGATENSLYHSQQMLKRNKSLRLKAPTIDHPIAAIKEAPTTKLSEYFDHLEHSAAGISPPLSIGELCLLEDDDEPIVASNAQQGLVVVVAPADEAGMTGGDAESRVLYYKNKFHFDVDTEEGQRRLSDVITSYLAGLQWCLSYYTRGCCSWSWFYPFHYGPFLSDMCNLQASTPNSSDDDDDDGDIYSSFSSFELDSPLKPFQQLLACLPAASSRLLPPPYRWLMEHPSSPLIGFYPGEFEVDRNDKKYDYEAVVLLPFIDIALLVAAEDTHCPSHRLTPEQLELNSFGSTYCYEMVRDNSIQPSSASNHRLQWSERSGEILPGACFRAELPTGTASSLVGFPSLREVLLLRNSAQPMMMVSSSPSSSEARRKPPADSFPMPGRVATPLGISSFAKESVCSMKTTTTTVTGSDTPLQAMQSSASATVNISMSFRIDTACSAYPFLNAIISQVTLKTAEFKPIVPIEQQQFTDAGLSQQRIMSIDCDLSDLLGYENMQAYDRYLLADVLPKMKGVLTPITGQLLPFCVVGIDGNVRIQYKDLSSDLMRVEEFLHRRLLGTDLTATTSSSSPDTNVDLTTIVEAADGSAYSSEASSNNSSNSNSSSCFSRYITIGSFHGSNADKFVTWLNSELKKLSSYMPSFTCRQLECLIEKEDATEDQTICFKF